MTTYKLCSLSALLLICTCAPSSPPEPIFVSNEDEVAEATAKVEALEDQVASLRGELENLRGVYENFGDGFTDWRDIVSELESSIDTVDTELSTLEDEIEDAKGAMEAIPLCDCDLPEPAYEPDDRY